MQSFILKCPIFALFIPILAFLNAAAQNGANIPIGIGPLGNLFGDGPKHWMAKRDNRNRSRHNHHHRHHRRPQNNYAMDSAEMGYLQEVRENWHRSPWHILHQVHQLRGLSGFEKHEINRARKALVDSISKRREMSKEEFRSRLPDSVKTKLEAHLSHQNVRKWHLNPWHQLHHIYHLRGLNLSAQERNQLENARIALEQSEMRGTPMRLDEFNRRLPNRLRRRLEQHSRALWQRQREEQQKYGRNGGFNQGEMVGQQADWRARRRVQIVRQKQWN